MQYVVGYKPGADTRRTYLREKITKDDKINVTSKVGKASGKRRKEKRMRKN